MKMQACPSCHESNPLEAVMCWACYTPLPAGLPRKTLVEKFRRWFGFGPVRRKDPIVRILDTIVEYAYQDKAGEIHIEPEKVDPPEGADAQQREKWNEVFGEAAFGVQVLYRVNGELCEQMKVPGYILAPLLEEIRKRCSLPVMQGDHQDGLLPIERMQSRYEAPVEFSRSLVGEKVIITLAN